MVLVVPYFRFLVKAEALEGEASLCIWIRLGELGGDSDLPNRKNGNALLANTCQGIIPLASCSIRI